MSGISQRNSKRKVSFILPVTIRRHFSLLQTIEGMNVGLVRMCVALYYISWIIFTLDLVLSLIYKQIVGIPMCTNCAPLVAHLFLFCYKRDFMTSLTDENQTYINVTLN